MPYEVREDAKTVVAKGVEWLDANIYNWWKHIDVDNLAMYSGSRCVLGQIGVATNVNGNGITSAFVEMCDKFGLDTNEETYKLGFNTTSNNDNPVTDEWKRVIRERQKEDRNPCGVIHVGCAEGIPELTTTDSDARVLLAIERNLTNQREALKGLDVNTSELENRLAYAINDVKFLTNDAIVKEYRESN